jgi:hypothetical protein
MNNKIIYWEIKYKAAHTAHNRTVYAAPAVAGLAYDKTQSGLRPLCVFSPAHFCKPWKPTVSFIGLAKTSYTAGTLNAILRRKIEENTNTLAYITRSTFFPINICNNQKK